MELNHSDDDALPPIQKKAAPKRKLGPATTSNGNKKPAPAKTKVYC